MGLAEALASLGLHAEPATVGNEDGETRAAYALRYGGGLVLAVPQPNDVVLLTTRIDLDDDEARLIGSLPKPRREGLAILLHREASEGRTGYSREDLPGEPGALRSVILEQQVLLRDAYGQRLLDGLQELAVIRVRCLQILTEALRRMQALADANRVPDYAIN